MHVVKTQFTKRLSVLNEHNMLIAYELKRFLYHQAMQMFFLKKIYYANLLKSALGNKLWRIFLQPHILQLDQWFSAGDAVASQGTSGNVWRHFGLS